MHPTNYPYTAAQPLYGDTHDSFQTNYFDAGYAQPQFPDASYQPLHTPVTYTPSPAPPREKRHKSRSHRQHHSSTPVHAPQPQQPPPPQLVAAQSSVRVCRVLTLLIEDKRGGEGDSMLTEVRVPLKQVDGGDVGFWVDAQDVTEELQKGPSRIDGRAKVYTLRGKYKQFFLRISADGEQVCQSANLKVAPDRTLEVFIEDVGQTVSYRRIC
ncbi:hypothetical protein OH76DRAFT_1357469 [Lentinus brumalis]|uniref:Uncharacterized protein n=1 Tax=Lentinus brumalis TaxID=2498619 RepID=A0A371CZC1_9APHY|nr:hypothetical protein OH76DRAFT_1357469 [Polyporus brumalis]